MRSIDKIFDSGNLDAWKYNVFVIIDIDMISSYRQHDGNMEATWYKEKPTFQIWPTVLDMYQTLLPHCNSM